MDEAEAEVSDGALLAVDRVVARLRGEAALLDEAADDLVEVLVDALVHAEAEPELHLEDEVGAEVVDRERVRGRLVGDLDVHEPVGAGTLGALVQD